MSKPRLLTSAEVDDLERQTSWTVTDQNSLIATLRHWLKATMDAESEMYQLRGKIHRLEKVAEEVPNENG